MNLLRGIATFFIYKSLIGIFKITNSQNPTDISNFTRNGNVGVFVAKRDVEDPLDALTKKERKYCR